MENDKAIACVIRRLNYPSLARPRESGAHSNAQIVSIRADETDGGVAKIFLVIINIGLPQRDGHTGAASPRPHGLQSIRRPEVLPQHLHTIITSAQRHTFFFLPLPDNIEPRYLVESQAAAQVTSCLRKWAACFHKPRSAGLIGNHHQIRAAHDRGKPRRATEDI